MNKSVKQLLIKHGITNFSSTKNGHIKLLINGNVIFTGSTPSDHRAGKNLESAIKRAKRN